jgi:hypothetical protein
MGAKHELAPAHPVSGHNAGEGRLHEPAPLVSGGARARRGSAVANAVER